jgi:hypothetical protein
MDVLLTVTNDYYAMWSGNFVSHRISTLHPDELNVHLNARYSVLEVTVQDI